MALWVDSITVDMEWIRSHGYISFILHKELSDNLRCVIILAAAESICCLYLPTQCFCIAFFLMVIVIDIMYVVIFHVSCCTRLHVYIYIIADVFYSSESIYKCVAFLHNEITGEIHQINISGTGSANEKFSDTWQCI